MQERQPAHGRNGHAGQQDAVVDLVLGHVFGFDPHARHIGCPISAPTRHQPLRDSVPDPSQTARRHGATGRDRIGGNPRDHVEIDESWVGGRTRGEGRGVHDQSLVIAAVEVRQRKPENVKGVPRRNGRYAGRIRMEVVPDRSARSLCEFVEAAVEPGVVVVTDAWGGYATLPDRGYRHLAAAAHGDPSMAEDFLPISHLIFSNLKSWLRGCHHGVSPQHLQAYLISGQAVAPTYDGLYSGSWQHPRCSRA